MKWRTEHQIEQSEVWSEWDWETCQKFPDSHQGNFRAYVDAVVAIFESLNHYHIPAEHSWCYQSTCRFGGDIWGPGKAYVDCDCPLLVNRSVPTTALRYDMVRTENHLQKSLKPNRKMQGLRVPSQKMIWVQRLLERQGSLEATC